MTDAELWELILISQGNSATAIALYISLVSGYLIVGYLAGKKLSTTQCVVITSLFSALAIGIIFQIVSYLDRAAFFVQFVSNKYISPTTGAMQFVPEISAIGFTLGVGACLKFMWDVRNPKTE